MKEAHSTLDGGTSWSRAAISYRKNEFGKKGFQIRRRDITKEEIAAKMDSGRKVDLRRIDADSLNDYTGRDVSREVVHDQPGKDFLKDVIRLFCVKMEETNGIFELTKGSFNAPAHGVETIEFIRGEIEIRDDSFEGTIWQLEADNTETELKRGNRDRLSVFQGEEIQNGVRGEKLKKGGSLGPSFGVIGLLTGKSQIDLDIKFIRLGNGKAAENTACAIFGADEKLPALLLNVSQDIIGFIASVGQDNGRMGEFGSVNHIAQGTAFIG